MSREDATAHALRLFDDGGFLADLARRVAIPTESQRPERAGELGRYLDDEMRPALLRQGFACRVLANPVAGGGPLLLAERIEAPGLPTVLTYGHGDVVRGQEGAWRDGLSPWRLTQVGDRLYGRGTADNKGQHSINLAALEAVLAVRGRLGFNAKVLIETSEEIGSPGLAELAREERRRLAADVLIASDGPRFKAAQPTTFHGSRGSLNFELRVRLREGAHHSGNWGGLLANPAILLAQALATITDARGRLQVEGWRPDGVAPAVRAMLAGLELEPAEGDPAIDPDWGEPGLGPVERLYAWNTFEVLAMEAGEPAAPQNAIPGHARALGHMRFVPGLDPEGFLPALRRHLDERGFAMVEIAPTRKSYHPASRTDPQSPWVRLARDSLARTTGKAPATLPNFGGALPNDVFEGILGLATVWVPHSHPGCSQHAPMEHMLASVAREGLQMMAGLFWDIGELGRLP